MTAEAGGRRTWVHPGAAEPAMYPRSCLGVQEQPTESLALGVKLSEHRGLL